MDQAYYSPSNFSLINHSLIKSIKDKHNRDIRSESAEINNMILETMDYVWGNVNSTVPTGYSKEAYMYLLNKKILNIIVPVVEENLLFFSTTVEGKESFNDPQFDSHIFNQNNPDSLIPLPQAQNQLKADISMQTEMDGLLSDRSELLPKEAKVNFKDPDYNENLDRIDAIYKDTLQSRNQMNTEVIHPIDDDFNDRQTSISDYSVTQANMNDRLENIGKNLEIREVGSSVSMSTPLDSVIIDQSTSIQDVNDLASPLFNRDTQDILIHPSIDPKKIYEGIALSKGESIVPPVSNIHREDTVILPIKNKLIDHTFFVTIDSHNRDLEIYPDPCNFQVKFAPASNSIEVGSLIDNNNNILYKAKTIYLGYQGATIDRTYNNIVEILCVNLSAPLTPVCKEDHSLNTVSILHEPYLFLAIDELEGPYEGTNTVSSNAFAKLVPDPMALSMNYYTGGQQFINMRSVDPAETHKYIPTNLGTIDKMTLSLYKKNGTRYFAGIDKLFVKQFQKGTQSNVGICNTNYYLTKIIINPRDCSYNQFCNNNFKIENKMGELFFTTISKGDILYFYDTTPNEAHIISFENSVRLYTMRNYNYVKNQPLTSSLSKDSAKTGVKITDTQMKLTTDCSLSSKCIAISAKIEPATDLTEYECEYKIEMGLPLCEDKSTKKFIDFEKIFSNIAKDYYIALSYTSKKMNYINNVFLKVMCINPKNKNELIIEELPSFDEKEEYEIVKFGFSFRNNRGEQSDNKSSLFYKGGIRVLKAEDNGLSFEINYPYKMLPKYIKDSTNNDIFLIQDKLQFSYTFRITEKVKDTTQIESRFV